MELKLNSAAFIQCTQNGFNRTFMELKFTIQRLSAWRIMFSFNRTFMELKYKIGVILILSIIRFNRTFMELK